MITLSHPHHLPLHFLSPSSPPFKRSNTRSAAMAMRFPGDPPPSHRELMASILPAVDARLGPTLLPSAVPPDVLSFRNSQGTASGALDIRSGAPDSMVDFILLSWLQCKVPTGDLNITSFSAFLNASVNVPHLLMEFIQGSPTSLILIMDLLPRKDLVLHPEYLDEFYNTNLDKLRQDLEQLPEASRYISSSLYIRSALSPTAIAVNFDSGAEGGSHMDEIIGFHISGAAKNIVDIWLDMCTGRTQDLGEAERAGLVKRDNVIKKKTIEIDLAASLPRLFDSDVVSRIVGELQKAYGI